MTRCLWAWRAALPERRSARWGGAVLGCAGAGDRAAGGRGGPVYSGEDRMEAARAIAEKRDPV